MLERQSGVLGQCSSQFSIMSYMGWEQREAGHWGFLLSGLGSVRNPINNILNGHRGDACKFIREISVSSGSLVYMVICSPARAT